MILISVVEVKKLSISFEFFLLIRQKLFICMFPLWLINKKLLGFLWSNFFLTY